MILGIDIGNSTIAFGFLRDGRVEHMCRLENMPESGLFRAKLDNFLEGAVERCCVRQVVVCSVVPETLRLLRPKIVEFFKVKPRVVGQGIRIPMVNRYRSPRQVGKDRLVCAFAAREIYGAPAIVIDLGTAITFDAISPKGEYLGGTIIPGLRLSVEALFEKTALLPRVRLEEPKKLIGRTTEESIQSGLFHGYGALCDGMISRLAEEIRCSPEVVMTGGCADIMCKYMHTPVKAVDPELIFKGLALLFRDRSV